MLAFALGESALRILGQAMISGTNLAIALMVGWVYGPAVFGVYSFFALIALVAVNVLTAALIEPTISLAAQMEVVQRRRHFSALALSYLALVIASIMPLHFALAMVQEIFLSSTSVNSALVTGFVIALVTLGVQRAFSQAFADGFVVLVTDFARSFLIMSGILAAVLAPYFGCQFDPVSLVLISQLIAIGSYVAANILYFAARGLIMAPDFAGLRGQHAARSGLATTIAVLRFGQVNAPILWTQFLLGEQHFGVVRTCQTIANFVSLPLFALRLHTMSSGAKAFMKSGTSALKTYIKTVLLRFVSITLVLSIILLLVMAILPSSLSPDVDSLVLICLFLLLNLTIAANTALTSYFFAKGDLMPILARLLLALVVSIALAPILLSALGMPGAPLAMLLVALFVTIVTTFVIRKDRPDAG